MDPYQEALDVARDLINNSSRPSITDDIRLSPIVAHEVDLTHSDQSWPFVFQPCQSAWARGVDDRWRRVTIMDAGQPFNRQGKIVVSYMGAWTHDDVEFREQFCPLDGALKPDTQAVRELLWRDDVQFLFQEDAMRCQGIGDEDSSVRFLRAEEEDEEDHGGDVHLQRLGDVEEPDMYEEPESGCCCLIA